MIIKLLQGQPLLKIRLSSYGCSTGKLDWRTLELAIREHVPDSKFVFNSTWRLEGCWPNYPGPRDTTPLPKPTLVYPAFDLDDDGRVVFQLDSKLWAWEPGRYAGSVVTRDGRCLASLDLDLGHAKYIIDQVEVVEEDSCAS